MKRKITLCCLFLLSDLFLAMPAPAAAAETRPLDVWSVQNEWKLNSSPVDFAQSLDRKWIFVLGDDSLVRIYAADGGERGSISVDSGAVALAIEARGKRLYLIDRNGTCKIFDMAFDAGAAGGTERSSWKTESRPIDVAADSETVFVLEEDNNVHVYAFSGQKLASIPVNPGTVAIRLLPRERLLCLVDQDNTYTAMRLSF